MPRSQVIQQRNAKSKKRMDATRSRASDRSSIHDSSPELFKYIRQEALHKRKGIEKFVLDMAIRKNYGKNPENRKHTPQQQEKAVRAKLAQTRASTKIRRGSKAPVGHKSVNQIERMRKER